MTAPASAGAIHPVHENPAPAFGTGMALPPRGLLELLDPPPLKKRRPPSGCLPDGGLRKKRFAPRYFPALLNAVSSPRGALTAVFGMGTGVTPPVGARTKEEDSRTDRETHLAMQRERSAPPAVFSKPRILAGLFF